MSKQIQDMIFKIIFDPMVTGVDYQMVKLVNEEGQVVISHPINRQTMIKFNQLDEDVRKKSLLAYLVVAYNYTRDYPADLASATPDFARTAWVCLEQAAIEYNLGEFNDEDFADIVVPHYNAGQCIATVTSPNGSEVVITLQRQNNGVWINHTRHFFDEDFIPTVEQLHEEWDNADKSRQNIEPVASMSFGEVTFMYAVDTSEAARVAREALLQVTIGDRTVIELKVYEGSKPLTYFILEVFNLLALRFKVGHAASVNEEDRVVLLNAISGLIGGHLGMGDHVQIEAGLMYAHEGRIDDQVSYVVTHQLTADNMINVNYRFQRMADDTMRRSVEMVANVDYLETPLTPMEFYNAYQTDIARELGVVRRFDISMIAAIDRANGLGKENQLLYRIKEDMQYFKETTLHSPVIMGRKTYDSLPNPLVDRLNIVITSQPIKDHTTKSGVVFVNSKEEALTTAMGYLTEHGGETIWIIGGAQIYSMFLPDAVELHLTVINDEREDADTFFPEFNHSMFDAERLFDQDEVVMREGEEISYNRYIMRRK